MMHPFNICFSLFQCTDIPITSELFVNVIKSTNNIEELDAVRMLVTKEMANLVSITKYFSNT